MSTMDSRCDYNENLVASLDNEARLISGMEFLWKTVV